ncbi:uncharacterized protein LOC126784942 [Argentina anserina]|uniref:uncharacterized protein LOC126784942 n=1 Tax=Argentina anserina TaxID=57926 RepID=UPI00217662B9|nr:uncharacterized protein LOC126784942 [Potentilla anserina]
MADKRQSFRFRFPWSNSTRSKKESEPSPTPKTQSPAQSSTTLGPGERPPFRPAGKAPVKDSPSQAQGQQKTGHPPSPAASESPKSTESPSRLSPSKKSHPSTQQSSPPSPATFQSQPVQEEAISQPQNHRRKIDIIYETDSSSKDSTPRATTSQTRETSPRSIKIFASSDKSDSDTLNGDHKQLSESETESKRHEKAERVVHIPAVEEKTNGYTEPLQERITQLHAAAKDSGNQAKDPLTVALHADQQHEKQEKATELHATPTESENHTNDPLGVALQANQQPEKQVFVTALHAVPRESGNHPKEPHGVALQAEQQHEKQASIDLGNHTKDSLGVALQADQRQEKNESFDRKVIQSTTSSGEKSMKTEKSSSRVSIQKMVASSGERAPPKKEIKEDVSKVDKLAIPHQMLDKPVGVVTLTGENRGAEMLLSSEPEKREEPVHIHRSYKLNPDDNEATTTDGEVSTTEEMFEDQMNEGDQQRGTYINSNVQSVNNSIVFNSSVTGRNPGVAIFPSNLPESIISHKDKSDLPQTHKSQVIQTPANRLAHESTVRRRCLRGLLLESSDSEPENPAKPRRHGCRYVCGKESKETDVGIV